MNKTILVGGATGNIGRELVPRLQSAGFSVRAGSTHGVAVQGAEGRVLDLLDPACLPAAFEGVDAAMIITPAHPFMVDMTANAVAAAREAGVGHLVRISGAGADPTSAITIARVQGQCDQHIIDSGLNYTLLRPKNFMQNFATFLGDMVRAGTVYSSQGDGRIPFIDVRDIAAVAAAVLTDPQAHVGQAYTLSGSQALTNAEALALISKKTGKPIELIPIPEEAAVEGMREAGMPEALIAFMSSLNQIIAAGRVAETSADVARIIGREPLSFEQFAEDYRDVWM
ncbi:MAG: SDR family oxidoreductase [Desulfobacterales bacterium]|nr:SDR family oxidoreductase [Desulfobacterales bacterium]MDJ0857270.1 SDR family oxidoreductase [Desulfobacterales bacterium]